MTEKESVPKKKMTDEQIIWAWNVAPHIGSHNQYLEETRPKDSDRKKKFVKPKSKRKCRCK